MPSPISVTLLICFAISAILTVMIITTARSHMRFSGDNLDGPQKCIKAISHALVARCLYQLCRNWFGFILTVHRLMVMYLPRFRISHWIY